MSRTVRRVDYHLDSKGIRAVPPEEIRAILRAADDLIMRGGRTLLVKILRGSRAKEVLRWSLDQSPAYGFYKQRTDDEVLARVDWLIRNGYLLIEYDGRLPLLIYTPAGWAIERETLSDELLRDLDQTLSGGQQPIDMTHLKDRNREMIWRSLDKIEASGDPRYIPALEAWALIDYKKVRQRIRTVIDVLKSAKVGS
jgi:RQC domain